VVVLSGDENAADVGLLGGKLQRLTAQQHAMTMGVGATALRELANSCPWFRPIAATMRSQLPVVSGFGVSFGEASTMPDSCAVSPLARSERAIPCASGADGPSCRTPTATRFLGSISSHAREVRPALR
jgi:hypothetical protein